MADPIHQNDANDRVSPKLRGAVEKMVATIVDHGEEFLSDTEVAILQKYPAIRREVDALVESRMKRAHPETYALAREPDAGDGAQLAIPDTSDGMVPRFERSAKTIRTTQTTRTTTTRITRTTRMTRLELPDEPKVSNLEMAD